jgi:hypothetical protein
MGFVLGIAMQSILIIDCRLEDWTPKLRARDLAAFLSGQGYTTTCYAHVYLKTPIKVWNDDSAQILKRECEHYDALILHVGSDQVFAQEALREVYADKFVICYTGGTVPVEVRTAIENNPKHCITPNDAIGADDTWPDNWKRSIVSYLKRIEAGDLEEARNLIKNFDSELEDTLNKLTEDFRELLLGSEHPTKESLERLAVERDRLLG